MRISSLSVALLPVFLFLSAGQAHAQLDLSFHSQVDITFLGYNSVGGTAFDDSTGRLWVCDAGSFTNQVNTIIPTGVSLNIGIIATTVEAIGRGFRVVIARDCASGDPSSYADDVYRNTLNNLAYLSSSQEIAKVWRS